MAAPPCRTPPLRHRAGGVRVPGGTSRERFRGAADRRRVARGDRRLDRLGRSTSRTASCSAGPSDTAASSRDSTVTPRGRGPRIRRMSTPLLGCRMTASGSPSTRRAMRRSGEPCDAHQRSMRRQHPLSAANHANKGRLRSTQDLENLDRFTGRSPAEPILAALAKSVSRPNPWSGSLLVPVAARMRSRPVFLDEEMARTARSLHSSSPRVRSPWERPWRRRGLATAISPPPEKTICAAGGELIPAVREDPTSMRKGDDE